VAIWLQCGKCSALGQGVTIQNTNTILYYKKWMLHIELWPLEEGCSRCGIFFVGLEITRRNSKVTGEIRAFP
jgi:hypothetical protein